MERVKIPNFLIVAIDTELRDYLTEKGVNVYYKDIQVRLCLLQEHVTVRKEARAGPCVSQGELALSRSTGHI